MQADSLQAFNDQRVAIVHDWLVVNGGAEKVLQALVKAFPHAEVFTLVNFMPEGSMPWLGRHLVHTSLLQRMPFAKRYYRQYLPLMPYAIEQFDLRGFDLVISSSHAVAKGVITHPDQTHICYCHTPMRYAWDMKEAYLKDAAFRLPGMESVVRKTLKRLRQWDYFTATQVDHFLANSHNVARRIAKYYRREADVLYPPVDIDGFAFYEGPRDDYFLAASRLVPYKRLDIIVQAFAQDPQKRPLKIVGDGPEFKRLARLAEGHDHIELLGYLEGSALHSLMQRARAFVFAADEDFGILPLEAQACGTPVIAYGRGGALETVKGLEHDNAATGVHFSEQTPQSINHALHQFEENAFDAYACRQHAERFSQTCFTQRLALLLASVYKPPIASESPHAYHH
ncbi:glycosyltransferase [Vreelandella salicampi]|uniref:Glycosyltransferase n=1 Tax=Vreelandella salicampi TaxID=1449798 RepID=A0A7Z0LK15_9GAMM|nr:glycosyltransferase [Halomonas salicampi]NYS60348.1 glycosyltransferase [Halomonas salicampi]